MPTRSEMVRLAERIASAPTAPYREHEVLGRIRAELDRIGLVYASDRWGNLLVRFRGSSPRGRPVAFTAHTDHPGLIITEATGKRAAARWIGGVQPRYFPGAAVRVETPDGPVRGRVRSFSLGPNGRVDRVELDLVAAVPVGAIGGWDLVPFRRDPPWLRTKSADDLLGCAALLSLLREIARSRPRLELWGIFTRAEEDGLLGAAALAEAGTLSKETGIVVLETSKELPCGRLGHGPIVRVGDRKGVYDPEIMLGLHEAALGLSRRLRSFQFQRGLMDGGICEATAFQAFGYPAGGLALPLGNYHNMGEKRIAEEYVHEDDLWNLARLLPAAAESIALGEGSLETLRRALSRRLRSGPKREMAATATGGPPAARARRGGGLRKGLATLLVGGLLAAAGSAPASPLIEEPDPPIGKSQTVPAALAPAAALQEDPRDHYDVLHIDLTIRIDPDTETIAGRAAIRLRVEIGLATVLLDLGETLEADSVACEGAPCTFTRPAPDQLEIGLPAFLEEGDSATIFVAYHGTPGPAFFTGFEFYSSHGQEGDMFPMVSTLSQPDRSRGWRPCKDTMDDKSTFALTVEAPQGFAVAGNGNRMREEVDGDIVRTTWQTSYPIAPYLVSFAATNYAVWGETYHAADGDSIPLLFYAYPEDEPLARIDFAATHAALDAFEARFGPYPFRNRAIGWEKLGVAQFAWASGAMEHQTCISYGDRFVTGDNTYDWVLAHEIAHQWWGDAVTPASMDDIWLNEGFATYCEALFAEARGGETAYRAWMRRLRTSVNVEFLGTVVRPLAPFSSTVYRKGAWTLHMLRNVLGEDRFFEALDRYYQAHLHATTSTEAFIRIVEETAGEDLRWFFIPWLYGTGRPQLAWDWWAEEGAAGTRVRLLIQQTQPEPDYPVETPYRALPGHFSFPLVVRAYAGADSVERTVFVDGRTAVAALDDLPFTPDRIVLDPDEWILREIQERGVGLPAARITVSPNPTAGPTDLLVRVLAGRPVEVAVYDVAGRRVRSLGRLTSAGLHRVPWDARNDAGASVAGGLYLARAGGEGAARIVIAR